MRRVSPASLTSATALAVMLSAAPASAASYASYDGGLTVVSEQWPNRALKTEYDSADVVKAQLDKAWSNETDAVCANVRTYVAALVKKQHAFLKSLNCSFPSTSTLGVDSSQFGDDVIGLRYVVTHNEIDIETSKPTPSAGEIAAAILTGGATAVAEGAADDPKFALTFDTVAEVSAHVKPAGVDIPSALVHIENANFDSKDWLADVALNFSHMKSQVETAVNNHQEDLRKQIAGNLGLLSIAFAPMQQQGYTRIDTSFTNDHLVLRFGGKTYAVPTSGPGTISGSIRLSNTGGIAPDTLCARTTVHAYAANGYDDVIRNASSEVPVGTVAAATSASPSACAYVLTSLPTGVPLRLVVMAPGTSSGYPTIAPQGWSGRITIPGAGAMMNSMAHMMPAASSSATTSSSSSASAVMMSPTTARASSMALDPGVHRPALAGNRATDFDFTLGWQLVPN